MTQAAIGGPAQTTYRVTSRQGVIGRDAQRVFVVSDGRPAEGGPQQAVYYVSDAEIAAGDFVISGNKPIPIAEVGSVGVEYPPIAVYVVTANSESDFPPQPDPTPPPVGPVPLLDLEADTLSLADGDPVSTWADQSGNHNDFTQAGSARPTYHTDNGVEFDAVDDILIGPNFADNLSSMTVISVAKSISPFNNAIMFAKYADLVNGTPPGFEMGMSDAAWYGDDQYNNGCDDNQNHNAWIDGNKHIFSWTKTGVHDSEYRLDGTLDDTLSCIGNVQSISNSGFTAIGLYQRNHIQYALRVYSPALSSTDRAAVEAELAARYGITL